MSETLCRAIASQLEAFVDGELPLQERLVVSRHLEACEPCARTADEHRAIGDALRRAAQEQPAPELAGLADGVLGRLQGERAETWGARLESGVDHWHWLLVGSGSLAATFIVTLFVSAVLIAGPAPERKDSLAGVCNNLSTSAGTLLVIGTAVGDNQNPIMLQVVGADEDPAKPAASVAATELGFASEGDLVRALAEAVTQNGRLVELASMPKESRAYAEKLLGDIKHLHWGGQPVASSGTVMVSQIVLRANASVSAKGL